MKHTLQSKITSKGQVTIPLSIREDFHLESGSKIEFINKGDHFVIFPLNKSVSSLKGILPKPDRSLSCDEMNNVIRQKS